MMRKIKEDLKMKHDWNVETKAQGRTCGAEHNASLEDLHPDGASVRNLSWPQPEFLVTSERC